MNLTNITKQKVDPSKFDGSRNIANYTVYLDGGFTSRPDLVVTAAGEEINCSVAVVGFSDVVIILSRGRGFRTTSA